MQSPYIIRSLGILLSAFSISMLPPILVANWYQENTSAAFLFAALLILFPGLLMWLPLKNKQYEPTIKDSFLIVVIFWVTLCLIGALPFLLTTTPHISAVDAIFETVSGLTATGATTLVGLDLMPRSVLYYRQQLQFLGGMGVILLAIAVLPALGVGGMQLFRAEISGPAKESYKLTPRIAQTAKSIWMIYVGINVFCALAYWAAGMELFDAIACSFGTVSTGGYAPHDNNIGYFQSQLIQVIAIIFMILGGTNFTLHFLASTNTSIKCYLNDSEFKLYISLIILASLGAGLFLYYNQIFPDLTTALLSATFHVVSLLTTTGFFATEYQYWPVFILIGVLLLSLIGGCSGSTSGGIKMLRFWLLLKQGVREINRLIHPSAYYVIKIGHVPVSERVINAVWGFLAVYIAIFALFLILLLMTGVDFMTAYSSTAFTLTNTGSGLGQVAENYKYINEPAKIILCCSMLIGRLELFTVLVLFSPVYWRS